MIVPMQKVLLVAHARDRQRLLEALGTLGLIHLTPIDPASAAGRELVTRIEHLERALAALALHPPGTTRPAIGPDAAADELLALLHREAQYTSRLHHLRHLLAQQDVWGEVQRADLDRLRERGTPLHLLAVPRADLAAVDGECVQILRPLGEHRLLVAVLARPGSLRLPASAVEYDPPQHDHAELKQEARALEETLRQDRHRLGELAMLLPELHDALEALRRQARRDAALAGGFDTDPLFVLKGWIPVEDFATLPERLTRTGVTAGLRELAPEPEDNPPTLIRYPPWVRPILGLFEMLNTLPGYRELDLGPFFMIALPLFAAILVGDAGYGLILLLGGWLGFRRITARSGRPAATLLVVIGVVSLIWGILQANYFGITPGTLARPGAAAWQLTLSHALAAVAPFWRDDPRVLQVLLIKMSLLIGCVHLVAAHVRRGIAVAPHATWIAEAGWSLLLVAMLGLIWWLFFGHTEPMPVSMHGLLATGLTGYALVLLFSYPDRGVAARLGLGLAGSLLPLLGTFSDTLSYIRLMAVSLATYYIADAMNGLIVNLGQHSSWILAAVLLLAAHALNLALVAIAILAHGVRLNMLEFSTNAGVQWAGYPFAPYRESPAKEL